MKGQNMTNSGLEIDNCMVSKSPKSHTLLTTQVQKNFHDYCKMFNIKNEAYFPPIPA